LSNATLSQIPTLVGAFSWDPCDRQRGDCCGRRLHWLSWQHLAWAQTDAVPSAATLVGLLCQQELWEGNCLRDGVFGTAAVFPYKNQNHIAQTTMEEGICRNLLLIMEL